MNHKKSQYDRGFDDGLKNAPMRPGDMGAENDDAGEYLDGYADGYNERSKPKKNGPKNE